MKQSFLRTLKSFTPKQHKLLKQQQRQQQHKRPNKQLEQKLEEREETYKVVTKQLQVSTLHRLLLCVYHVQGTVFMNNTAVDQQVKPQEFAQKEYCS